MLVSDLIYRIRNLSGFKSQDSILNSGIPIANDNVVLEAINNAQKQLAQDQFRPFLQTVSLSPRHTLGNDQYLFLDNYGWDSRVTNSTSPATNYLKIPTREMQTRPLYFYEEGNYRNSSSAFMDGYITYYPNEFSTMNGWMTHLSTHTVTPYANIHVESANINTFKVSFNIYSESEPNRSLFKFDISLSNSPYVFKRVNGDLTIIVDFANMKISYLHKARTNKSYVIEFLSYMYGNAGSSLLYNGKIRRIGANHSYNTSKDIQLYVIPYSVVDPSQSISEIISGSSDVLEYFIYECVYQLQLSLRDVDQGLADIRNQKRNEYLVINKMETYNNHAYFPSL